MSHLFTNCLPLTAVCSLLLFTARSQSPTADSMLLRAENRAISIYDHALGDQLPVYNGEAHLSKDPSTNGSSYFPSAIPAPGSVVYDGVAYSGLSLLYDKVRDQVIYADRNGSLVELSMDKVSEFSIQGHHFLHFPKGCYELLTTGTITVYASRTRFIDQSISGDDIIHTVKGSDRYYAIKNGTWYELTDERHLLELMADRKKEVKEFIRNEHIRWDKSGRENALLALAGYYNQLTR